MAVADLFSRAKGGKIFQKNIAGKGKWINDKTMREFSKDPTFRRFLDKPAEKRELHGLMKEMSKDGLTKTEMKEILGKGMAGKLRTLDRKEMSAMAEALFHGEKVKYILPKDAPKYERASGRGAESKVEALADKGVRPNTAKYAPVGRRASIYRTDSKEEASKDKSGDFFRAINATMRNKGN